MRCVVLLRSLGTEDCYTCPQFSAFEDGAHEAVLQSLVIERNELLAANHDRIAEQLDRTILAVGEAVARIGMPQP
jgi:hypothetical protein